MFWRPRVAIKKFCRRRCSNIYDTMAVYFLRIFEPQQNGCPLLYSTYNVAPTQFPGVLCRRRHQACDKSEKCISTIIHFSIASKAFIMLTALASIMTGTSLFIAKLRKISDFGVCSADSSQALPGSQSDGSNNNSLKKNDPPLEEPISKPISVNYHFHRVCNYNCGFCFHTNTNSFKLSLDDAKAGLRKLQEAGMKKVSLSLNPII